MGPGGLAHRHGIGGPDCRVRAGACGDDARWGLRTGFDRLREGRLLGRLQGVAGGTRTLVDVRRAEGGICHGMGEEVNWGFGGRGGEVGAGECGRCDGFSLIFFDFL